VLPLLFLEPTQPSEIYNIINTISPSEACDRDNISAVFLRIRNQILAPVLPLYFDFVLESGIFPHIFKTAKVIPIYKLGNKNLIKNKCPISILPSLSKVEEKLIKNRLVNIFTNILHIITVLEQTIM